MYIKKEVRGRVHFLHADKFLQLGIFVFDGSSQTCPEYPKYFYCDAKHLDNLRGPVTSLVTCFVAIFFAFAPS